MSALSEDDLRDFDAGSGAGADFDAGSPADRPRGAHFAKSSSRADATRMGAAHRMDSAPARARYRSASSQRPDETSVYLDAARLRAFAGASPDETSVYINAAAGVPAAPEPIAPAPALSFPASSEDDLFAPLQKEGGDRGTLDAGGTGAGGSGWGGQTVPSASAAPAASGIANASEDVEDEAEVLGRAEKSSNMVSLLVILSRITGFFRTTAQAWAVGATMLASCYTIATQLPNVMYELVVGGMLITSFLPVYVKVRDRVGKEGASAYASNLLSVMLILMVLLTIVSFIFAGPIIWTQSAGAAKTFDADLAVWFFRWFCVEIILYALSSVFSGVLNAERDYLWSNAAPVFNNIIVISAFGLYGALTRSGVLTQSQAMIILALGNPLGVATQVLVQVPALRRHGVRLRLRANFRDPALRETLSIGLPTLVVTLAAYPTNAVMSSSMMSVTDAGAAIIYYARVWYVLPFSIFAIPISVTMFTELSHYFVRGDMASFVSSFSRGACKILFTTIPFTFYFIVFAGCLIAIISGGSFSGETADMTASYLAFLSLTLPFYALSIYLQKTCSALLSMKFFAMATVVAAVAQVAVCIALTPVFGMPVVPLSSAVYFIVLDLGTLVRLRGRMGQLGLRAVAVSVVRAVALGAAGALVGWGILQALIHFAGPMQGVLRSALYAVAGGVPALIVTFGTATLLNVSDAPFFDSIFRKVLRRPA